MFLLLCTQKVRFDSRTRKLGLPSRTRLHVSADDHEIRVSLTVRHRHNHCGFRTTFVCVLCAVCCVLCVVLCAVCVVCRVLCVTTHARISFIFGRTSTHNCLFTEKSPRPAVRSNAALSQFPSRMPFPSLQVRSFNRIKPVMRY